MVSVEHGDLQNLLGALSDATLPPARAENLIDQAIDMLNMHGLSISNMSGSEGSKTVTLTSGQRGAVLELGAMIYRHRYTNPQQASIGPLSVGGTGTTEEHLDYAAKRYARQLMSRTILRT